jgi:hypothetical protein
MVSWYSRKQSSVALSTAKAEYIALCVASQAPYRPIWTCENLVFHDKSKHIEIKYHYIRDMVQRKEVHVQYLSTHKQVADVFTKPLARKKFEYFRVRLGLVENASLTKREC